MYLRASLAVTAALVGALGCASLKPPLTPPAQGGFPWTEITSRHFVLKTDLDPDDAREAALEFERVYEVFTDVAFPTDESRVSRIDVVIFRRPGDYQIFGPKGTDAYFNSSLHNDLEPVPTTVMSGGFAESTRITFQHELTHHFMRQSLSSVPVWLNEGMAEYYSTLRIEGGKLQVGRPLPTRAFTRSPQWFWRQNGAFQQTFMPFANIPPVGRLVNADRETFYAARSSPGAEATPDLMRVQTSFYGGAWALVHMMMTGPELYRARFASFIDAVSHGKGARDAWEDHFYDIDADRFQRDLNEHMLLPIVPVLVKPYKARPPQPPEQERTLSDAEVHLLWARLSPPWGGPKSSRAQAQLDAARALEPTSPEIHLRRGLFLLATRQSDEADAEIAAALRARADDPHYLLAALRLALARPTPQPGEARALTDRLAKVARTATQLDAVARSEAKLHEADAGLPFAARAIKAGPTCWRCVDTYATLLAEKGRMAEAAAAEARAIDLLPEELNPPGLSKRLRDFQAAAKKQRKESAPPASSPPASSPPAPPPPPSPPPSP